MESKHWWPVYSWLQWPEGANRTERELSVRKGTQPVWKVDRRSLAEEEVVGQSGKKMF